MLIDRQVSSQWLFFNDCILLFSLQYPQGLEWQKVHFSPNEHLIRVAHALPPFGRHAVSQQSHGGRGSCHCISNSCSVTHSLTWQELRCGDSAASPHPGSLLPWPRPSSRQAGQQLCLQLLPTLVLAHHSRSSPEGAFYGLGPGEWVSLHQGTRAPRLEACSALSWLVPTICR